MFIAIQTLRNYKKKYDVPFIKAPMRNRQGITEEQFKQAESIGLDRHVVLLRVREYGWTIEKAISTPKKARNKR